MKNRQIARALVRWLKYMEVPKMMKTFASMFSGRTYDRIFAQWRFLAISIPAERAKWLAKVPCLPHVAVEVDSRASV